MQKERLENKLAEEQIINSVQFGDDNFLLDNDVLIPNTRDVNNESFKNNLRQVQR